MSVFDSANNVFQGAISNPYQYASDIISYEGANLDRWGKHAQNNPVQLVMGAEDPFTTDLWNNATGSHWTSGVNQYGGPSDETRRDIRRSGYNTGPGEAMHSMARAIVNSKASDKASGSMSDGEGGGGYEADTTDYSGGGNGGSYPGDGWSDSYDGSSPNWWDGAGGVDVTEGAQNAAAVVNSTDNLSTGLQDLYDQPAMDVGNPADDFASEATSSYTAPDWWNKISKYGTQLAKHETNKAVRKEINQTQGGRDLTKGYDMYNGYTNYQGTPGINGNNGQGGNDGFDWVGAATGLAGLYQGNQAHDALDKQRQALQSSQDMARQQYQNMPTLDSMYGPNSPYAQQMRQTLARQDAKAGRNSQYGPREAQYQAHMADKGAQYASSQAQAASHYNNAIQGSSAEAAKAAQAQQQIRAQQLGSLSNYARKSGLFNGLGSLFGGSPEQRNGGDMENTYPWEGA